jgi:hypothetical protein
MKKTLTFATILAAALTLTLASCTQSEVIETPIEEAIGFTTFTKVPTKANVLNGTSLESLYTQFTVKSFQGTTTFMDNIIYSYNSAKAGAWYYNSTSDVKYWPNAGAALDFYGYTISDFSVPTVTPADQHLTISAQNTPAGVGDDVLYAECLQASKADRDGQNSTALQATGSVPMVFKHALSQVNFKLQNTNANTVVKVSEIDIQNVNHSADVKFDGTYSEIAGTRDFVAAASIFTNAEPYTVTSDAVRVQANANLCSDLMVPQATAKWDIANKVAGARFAIKCTVSDAISGVIYQNGYVYIPVEINWQSGKNYTYTIIFGEGAGYDEDGNEVLQVITFDPSVEDWADVSSTTNM